MAILADILWRNEKQTRRKRHSKKAAELDGKMDLDLPMIQRLKPIAKP